MNFLAHLYLTKDQPEKVIIGNFMGDAIKGKKAVEQYEEGIKKGLKIHRSIDRFTDKHELFRKGTKRLHGNYGKFASIIMDIFYDHILARNWEQYSKLPLQTFAQSQYDLIDRNIDLLPIRTLRWFHYMKRYNMLFNYSNEEEIDLVFQQMDQRTGSISGMSTAINELIKYQEEYTLEFHVFFEEIQGYIANRYY